MNKLLLVLVALTAGTAKADAVAPEADCHYIKVKVCKAPTKKKAAPKKVVAPTKPTPNPIVLDDLTIEVVKDPPKPKPAKKPLVAKPVEKVRKPMKTVERDPNFVPSIHVAVGLGLGSLLPHGSPDSNVSGLYGLRLHFPKVRLGGEIYTTFAYGMGLQAMVFPYQSKSLDVHVDLGVMFGKQYALSVTDVPRTWDATFGAGMTWKATKHLGATLDWKMVYPNPVWTIANDHRVVGGRYLDATHVLTNSVAQSQLLVGLVLY